MLVFGRTLLEQAGEAEIEARFDAERAGRARCCSARTASCACSACSSRRRRRRLTGQSLLDQSRLDAARFRPAVAVRRLRARRRALFLPRPDPGQEICRADRRRRQLGRDRAVGPPLRPGRLADRAVAACRAARQTIYARLRRQVCSELDGQLLLALERADDAEARRALRARRGRRGGGALRRGGRALPALPRHRPGDAVAAFNRANCLRAAGRLRRGGARLCPRDQARSGLRRGLVQPRRPAAERGQHRRGAPASAARRSRSTPTMPTPSTIWPRSNIDAGNLAEARRWWVRYLELDQTSDWAQRARRAASSSSTCSSRQQNGRLMAVTLPVRRAGGRRASPSCSPMAPARRWIRPR